MHILIIGSGGREHAFAWKMAQSPRCKKLFVAPGNAGTASIAENVAISPLDFDSLGKFVDDNHVELVVIGPEDPLVAGLADFFEARNVAVIGPGKEGAKLEGSKDFSKDFMLRHNIPTADYKTFSEDGYEKGLAYIDQMHPPVVLKADGLAAGKGVIIAATKEDAKLALYQMLKEKKFGSASAQVVIEEFLEGIELSVFVLTDGANYVLFPEAKDYKRIGEHDQGLNTGGMGAVSPVPFADDIFLEKVRKNVVQPTIDGLKKDNIAYKGFIFIGLMNVNGEPIVIEYNVRMGDPETEVVIPRIQNDLVDLFMATAETSLNQVTMQIDERYATTVVLVSGGYPDAYKKGLVITGLKEISKGLVFHAGTAQANDTIVTNGGRVLAMTGMGSSLQEALDIAYEASQQVCWEGLYYRRDIGQDLMAKVKEKL